MQTKLQTESHETASESGATGGVTDRQRWRHLRDILASQHTGWTIETNDLANVSSEQSQHGSVRAEVIPEQRSEAKEQLHHNTSVYRQHQLMFFLFYCCSSFSNTLPCWNILSSLSLSFSFSCLSLLLSFSQRTFSRMVPLCSPGGSGSGFLPLKHRETILLEKVL